MPLQQVVYRLAKRPHSLDIAIENSFRLFPTVTARQSRIPNSRFPPPKAHSAHCLLPTAFELFPPFALGQVDAQQNQRAAGDNPRRDFFPKQPCP